MIKLAVAVGFLAVFGLAAYAIVSAIIIMSKKQNEKNEESKPLNNKQNVTKRKS